MFGGFIIALIVLAGLSPLLWRFYVHHRWIPARGTVVRKAVHESHAADSAWTRHPSVEFVAHGQTHTFQSRWANRKTAPPRFNVGDAVDILYSPRKPTRAIIRTWGRYLRWAAVAEICILAIFLAPILLAFLAGNK